MLCMLACKQCLHTDVYISKTDEADAQLPHFVRCNSSKHRCICPSPFIAFHPLPPPCSATMPIAVERLARKYLRKPVIITIGSAGKVTDNVSQRVVMCKENEKARTLEQEVTAMGEKRVIVFVNTQRQCDNVYRQCEEMGYSCTVLHGGKNQDQREAGIKGFR